MHDVTQVLLFCAACILQNYTCVLLVLIGDDLKTANFKTSKTVANKAKQNNLKK